MRSQIFRTRCRQEGRKCPFLLIYKSRSKLSYSVIGFVELSVHMYHHKLDQPALSLTNLYFIPIEVFLP